MTVVETPRERDPMDAAARDDLRGLFEIETVHRRGPASLVCIARDLEYDQQVALKVLPRTPGAGGEAEEAFHRAAACVAGLEHPHVVPIFSAGATDRFFWCSMEYVEGPSLAEELDASGPMALAVCLALAEQVGSALEAAHRLGIVHANLTPTNVLIDATGNAHVTDFWVPWVLEQLGALGGAGSRARGRDYRGPEVSPAREPGPHADQYALAVLVHQCLSGKVPVVENPLKAIAQGRVPQPPPRLAEIQPGVPLHVSQAVERALAPAPDARFPDVREFVTALRARAAAAESAPAHSLAARTRVLLPENDSADADPQPAPARRWRWVPAGVLTLVVLGAVAAPWLLSSGSAGDQSVSSGAYTPAPTDSLALLASTLSVPDSVALAPPPPVVRRPASIAPPPRRAAARPLPNGRLFINAMPWGQVYVDGELIGNTPRVDVPVSPGSHQLRVVRDGFQPYELAIRVAPGQELRLTDIVLQELKP